MKLSLGQVFADAAALWRADRDLLVRVSAVFFFLPAFALALFLPDPAPLAESATDMQRMQAIAAYAQDTLPWTLSAQVVGMIGVIALYRSYLGVRRPMGEQLTAALAQLPLFAAALLLAFAMFAGGFLLFVMPGLYVAGRVFLAGPAMIAEERREPIDVLARSMELSRGNGWALFSVQAVILVPGWFMGLLVGGVANAVQTTTGSAAVAQLVAAPLVAGISMATSLAVTLTRITAYRRLAGSIKGT